MKFLRYKKLLFIKVTILSILIFILANWISDNKLIGGLISIIAPKAYKYLMQKSRLSWFSNLALDQDLPLHVASGWNYLSESEFNEIVDQVTNQITIEENDSVFELGQSFQISFKCFGHNQGSIFSLDFLGCGTGAALLRIKSKFGVNKIGGSDLSKEAIDRVRQTFPQQKSQFHVISMTEKDVQVQDESQDVVLSLGAFAMYLYKDEMEIALKEALRMAKMGGRLCFTHFIEPNGRFLGTILEPLPKSQWKDWALKYTLKDIKINQMIHQHDRYFVCFTK